MQGFHLRICAKSGLLGRSEGEGNTNLTGGYGATAHPTTMLTMLWNSDLPSFPTATSSSGKQGKLCTGLPTYWLCLVFNHCLSHRRSKAWAPSELPPEQPLQGILASPACLLPRHHLWYPFHKDSFNNALATALLQETWPPPCQPVPARGPGPVSLTQRLRWAVAFSGTSAGLLERGLGWYGY